MKAILSDLVVLAFSLLFYWIWDDAKPPNTKRLARGAAFLFGVALLLLPALIVGSIWGLIK